MDDSHRAPSLVGDSDEFAQWDAAYVLGSLPEADRGAYEAHLRGCPSCQRSVEELSGIPAVLGQLTPDEAAAIDDRNAGMPPSRVLTSLLDQVSRRRRNARLVTWTAAAAAAAAIVFAVTFGVGLRPAAPTSAPRQAASALTMTRVADTELIATVAMTGHRWGTQIEMNCNYPAESHTAGTDENEPPDRLAMEVVGRDGNHDRLATWTAVNGVDATPVGSTSMPIDQIASIQIVSADTGSVLLQRTL